MIFILSPDSRAALQHDFGEVRPVEEVSCRYCMTYEAEMVIFLCREPRVPIQELWKGIKSYH
jgi:hypothetical protein